MRLYIFYLYLRREIIVYYAPPRIFILMVLLEYSFTFYKMRYFNHWYDINYYYLIFILYLFHI